MKQILAELLSWITVPRILQPGCSGEECWMMYFLFIEYTPMLWCESHSQYGTAVKQPHKQRGWGLQSRWHLLCLCVCVKSNMVKKVNLGYFPVIISLVFAHGFFTLSSLPPQLSPANQLIVSHLWGIPVHSHRCVGCFFAICKHWWQKRTDI